jgi:hypothetical protein
MIFDTDFRTVGYGGVIAGALLLSGCGGEGSTSAPPIITVPAFAPAPTTSPSTTVAIPNATSAFSAPQQIAGISINQKMTPTFDLATLNFSLNGGFYFANGILSVLPIFYPSHAVNADPTLVGKNTDVYLSEFSYRLNGLSATPVPSAAKVSYPGAGTDGAVVADFNGDGIQDVFIADHGYDASPFPGGQNSLLFGTAGGGFVAGKLPAVLDFTHSATVADIDSDGDIDIFVGNIGKPNPIDPYFLINDGKGNFTQNFNLLSGLPGKFPSSQVNAKGLNYTGSHLSDVNKDGKIDLILTGFGNGSELLSWDGSKFVVKQNLYLNDDANRSVTSVDIADLDNDGKNEIILHSTTVASTNYYKQDQIDVLKQNASGSYQLDQTVVVSGTAWNRDLYVDDVNNDGFADLISLGTDSKIILNDKGKLFVAEYKFPFDSADRALGMLDLNSDGHLDIIYSQVNAQQSTQFLFVNNLYVMFG